MMDSRNSAIESVAQSVVDGAAHYVASVKALSSSNDMRTTEDIVSSSGIKLVARGMRIDAGLHEKLFGHHLSGATLEKSLSIAGGVTPDSLAIDMGAAIEGDAWFRRLEAVSGDPAAMRYGASFLKLPREILFRLTVARDQRPALYRHLLSVAIIGQYLALRLQLKQGATNNVLIAALCHDLGELYTSPAILESGHQ